MMLMLLMLEGATSRPAYQLGKTSANIVMLSLLDLDSHRGVGGSNANNRQQRSQHGLRPGPRGTTDRGVKPSGDHHAMNGTGY